MSRRANPDASHIRLYHWMLKSPAWGALSGNERAVLLDLWMHHSGINNGQISYSCEQAGKAISATKMTGSRALQRLVQLRFLRITRDAGFGSDDARLYTLTMEPVGKEPGKEPPTKDFMKLTADELAKNHFPVTPRLLPSNTSVTGKNGTLKIANKINGVAGGAGDRKDGTSRNPRKTAKKPTKPAENLGSRVTPVLLGEPSPSNTGVTHIIYHATHHLESTSSDGLPSGDLEVTDDSPRAEATADLGDPSAGDPVVVRSDDDPPTGARPTQSIVLKVAKAIYRTHNRPPLPPWDHTSQEMRDLALAQAGSALDVVPVRTADHRLPASLVVTEVAPAIYGTHRRPDTPTWDRTTPDIRTWVTAQAAAALTAINRERSLIRDRNLAINIVNKVRTPLGDKVRHNAAHPPSWSRERLDHRRLRP
jgi:hypothetical protein